MSQQATMTRVVAAQHRHNSRPEPAFPWRVHRFNPSVPPLGPDPDVPAPTAPIMWHNQCRDCFGWVDDPRHS